MTRRMWMLVPALAGAALLAACADQGGVAGPRTTQDPLVERLVEMGARRDQIVDRGDHFVVEGDIRVDKSDLRARRLPGEIGQPGDARKQRLVDTVTTSRRVIHVNLAAVDAENASWAAATRAAMSNWSSISGVNLSLVEGGTADITVYFVNSISTCTVAQGAWPASGAPGTTVQISRQYAGSYSYSQMVWIMSHELGHNIGLAHTDQTFGTIITGTPATDAASVMNSGSTYGGCPPAAPSWSAFSYYDQLAAKTLYPLRAPAPSVTNSGGTPLISWSALPAATSYSVDLVYTIKVTSRTDPGWSEEDITPLGTTTGTSFSDTGHPWTGVSSCYATWPDYSTRRDTWRYRVTATYPTGSTFTFVAAPVGDC